MRWRFLLYCLSLIIVVVSCGQDPIIVPEGSVELLMRPPEMLSLSNPSTTLKLRNPGTKNSSWKLTIHQDVDNPDNDWLSLSSHSGTLSAGQGTDVTLSLLDNLASGVYRATLVFNYQNKSKFYQVVGLISPGHFEMQVDNSDVLSPTEPLSIPVTINRQDGFDAQVTLALAGLPDGVQGTFTPNPATTQSILELSNDGTTAPGSYTIAVLGNSDGAFASANVSVLVASTNTEYGFNLSLEKPILEFTANQSVTTNLMIHRSNGFATPITVSTETLPTGLTISFDPNPVTSQTALTLQAAPTLTTGHYTLKIKGLADNLERSTTLQVHILANQSARLNGTIFTDNARASNPALPATYTVQNPNKVRFVADQLLVKYRETPISGLSTQSENRQLLSQAMTRDYGLRVIKAGGLGQHDLIETSQDVLAMAKQLQKDPRVEYAEPNYLLETLELPNDPGLSEQWALPVAGLPVAWSVENGSSNPVTVAVIDTGFNLNHPDLKGRFLPGFDFCKKSEPRQVKKDGQLVTEIVCTGAVDKNPTYGDSGNYHGTHVAGLVAAIGNNNTGIAGAAFGNNIKLLPIKIFDDSGNAATVDTFVNAIRWAVGLDVEGAPLNANPARIISLSLGGRFPSQALQDVVNEAHQQGALILAATGNDSAGTIRIPASCNNVIGVGSVEINYTRSSFSNYSAETEYGPGVVDVMAPGGSSNGGVLSTMPEGYEPHSGTSMATPIAAGIAALMLSQNPGLSVTELERALLSSSYFDPEFMSTTEYGKGVLRADVMLGLPGPESTVTLVLSGPTIRSESAVLNIDGTTEPFSMEALEPGNYKLDIIANGSSAQLAKTVSFQLTENQSKNLEITLP